MMMRNKSDEAEMTFFFLSLLLVKEGMDIYIYIVRTRFNLNPEQEWIQVHVAQTIDL